MWLLDLHSFGIYLSLIARPTVGRKRKITRLILKKRVTPTAITFNRFFIKFNEFEIFLIHAILPLFY